MAELPGSWRTGLRKARRELSKVIELPADYDALTRSQRAAVRQTYVEQQGGDCYHCGCPLDGEPAVDVQMKSVNWRQFPGGRSFLEHPVHLHHDHGTGLTIGAVHALCNAVLWQHHGE